MIFWRDWWCISLKGVVLGDGGNAFFKCFNSIKVRLRRKKDKYTIGTLSIFQFHKGSIKTNGRVVAAKRIVNFNSIKVRLRRNTIYEQQLPDLFQFHKGTIKTMRAIYKLDKAQ